MPRTDLEIDQIREPYTKSFLKNAAGKERKDTPSRYGSSGKTTIYNAHKNGALPIPSVFVLDVSVYRVRDVRINRKGDRF